jgi:hypothetical protein
MYNKIKILLRNVHYGTISSATDWKSTIGVFFTVWTLHVTCEAQIVLREFAEDLL